MWLSDFNSITGNEQDGAVHVTDMEVSALKYGWSLTINTDAAQKVSDQVFSRNPSVGISAPDPIDLP